jgi:WD40-like Beta Propeller Repeat
MRIRGILAAALVAAPVAALAGGDRPATAAGDRGYRILLNSNRDGVDRAYSVRADGSRLTPLVPRGRRLEAADVSGDGRMVAYVSGDYPRHAEVWVSSASGAGLRRIGGGVQPVLSQDGKLLAYVAGNGIAVARTNGRGRRLIRTPTGEAPDWSPDGKSLLFAEQIHEDPDRYSVVVKPLRGPRHVLFRTGPADAACITVALLPTWSPDGRSIAYDDCEDDQGRAGLYVVRLDGTHRRRLAPNADEFAWSPNGKRLVLVDLGRVAVVGVDGRGYRRLRLGGFRASRAIWSPGGRRLILSGWTGEDDRQIWTVGLDGRGLRRVTSSGSNGLVDWTRVAPIRPPAPPLPRTERVLGPEALAVRSKVTSLAADGGRVALVAARTPTDCDHVAVWTPAEKSVRRFRLPSPCLDPAFVSSGVYGVGLAGSRAAWISYSGNEGECDFRLETATLARPAPVPLTAASFGGCSPEAYDLRLRGDGGLLVFDDGDRLVRIEGGRQATLRTGSHAAPVDSVSDGLIAILEPDAVAVLDERGEVVRVFPFASGEVSAARLDGGRLVVARASALDVYDVASGALVLERPLSSGEELTDVDGGVAVLLRGVTITLLRLEDGRSTTLAPDAGPVLADLEPSGLYYAFPTGGGSRVVFVPRASLLRQLR